MRADEFSIVGVYDVDWLLEPRFQRLLDNMAASPGAFKTVRFFGSLSSGTLENNVDDDPPAAAGGVVWPSVDAPMDFSATFRALETLTSRGLTPFVVLTFFPPAVSDRATSPPASFDDWKRLVRGFLDQLAADPRFGESAIRDWWFEVWNEPNMGGFWAGSFAQYLDLYWATSQAVIEAGYDVRLGGPAIAYLPPEAGPGAGAPLMEAFLRFLGDEPEVKCDFISLHRKGAWGPGEPELESLISAAEHTANLALAIDPDRFRGIPIVNNEADMRVGFNIPYEPRMDERFPAWMTAVTVAYGALSSRFSDAGIRFLAASDNANQQLIQSPFDGRRSVMTRASEELPHDLLKVPVFNFYEFLRLVERRHGTFVVGGENFFPNGSELFHAITAAESHIGAIFAVHPRSSSIEPRPWSLDYKVIDIPWPRVNVARFQIDAWRSNSYAAAGRPLSMPSPAPLPARRIRRAQELTVFTPIRRNVALANGEFRDAFDIDPFTATMYWITPSIPDPPAAPQWIEATVEGGNVVLRWKPNPEPFFYSYEVYRMEYGEPVELLSPVPLRAAMWVDTAPSPGPYAYGIRAVSASGVASATVPVAPW